MKIRVQYMNLLVPSMQKLAYSSYLVDLVDLASQGFGALLGKFIEIDCLFRRNRPKNPASGGWGGLPQTPRLAYFRTTSPCLIIIYLIFFLYS